MAWLFKKEPLPGVGSGKKGENFLSKTIVPHKKAAMKKEIKAWKQSKAAMLRMFERVAPDSDRAKEIERLVKTSRRPDLYVSKHRMRSRAYRPPVSSAHNAEKSHGHGDGDSDSSNSDSDPPEQLFHHLKSKQTQSNSIPLAVALSLWLMTHGFIKGAVS